MEHSPLGTFSISTQSYSILNNQNTAWGTIVGTSTLTISGSAMIGSSSSTQTSKKNEDGSTTYTVTVNISVTEKVSGSYGTFTQIKNLAPYTITHTVPE